MSGEKTELPTQKKLRDSAKKGQSYKSRDMVAACILIAGMLYMTTLSFSGVGVLFEDFISRGNNISPSYAGKKIFELFIQLTLPFVGVCIVATVLPSLLQSKFALAFEAIKIDFEVLNPISGLEKIFSLKTVKEFIKALLYLVVFSVVTYLFYQEYRNVLYSLIYAQPLSIASIWLKAGVMLLLLCLGSFFLIILLDGLVDYYLYIKNLKMEKHEVKQEYKEQEGNPEVKHRRRELHQEVLSAQMKNDIEQSNFVLANPTHIAIGIYMDSNITPLPFISVLTKDEKARAVIAYAQKIGKPVVRDIPIARRLFKKAELYSFIPIDELEPIVRILQWLHEVEHIHLSEAQQEANAGEAMEQANVPGEATEDEASKSPEDPQNGQSNSSNDQNT